MIWRFHRTLGPLLALLLAMSGCTQSYWIREGYPRPNLALAPQPSSMKLELASDIADAFDIRGNRRLRGSNFQHWHGTLRNGFANGFGTAFQLVPDATPSDYVLLLEEASPQLVLAPMGPQLGVEAQIRYRAALIEPSGARRFVAGTAGSKTAATERVEINGIVVSAVETMYEEIAAKLFGHATTAAPSSPTEYAPPIGTEGHI